MPNTNNTKALSKQIQDAFVSGSHGKNQKQQQEASEKAIKEVKDRVAFFSASIEDENIATAVVNDIPQKLVDAITHSHGFIPLFEIKGRFNPSTLPPRVEKILNKLADLGLKATVMSVTGQTSQSLQLGIRLA